MTRTTVCVLMCLVCATGATADYTVIKDSPGNEENVADILNHLYDTSFSMNSLTGSSTGSDGSGSLTITRVMDFVLDGQNRVPGSDLELAGDNHATATDQVWIDGIVDTVAAAKFAGFMQDFGYYAGDGPSTDSFVKLFTVTGSNYNVGGSQTFNTDDADDIWRWVRGKGPQNQGQEYSSRDSDNSDNLDHMVTFFIERANANNSWFVLFEDLNGPGAGSDRDFNDLAVELEVIPPLAMVPLPHASGLAAAGLLILAARRRR